MPAGPRDLRRSVQTCCQGALGLGEGLLQSAIPDTQQSVGGSFRPKESADWGGAPGQAGWSRVE